jgi:DNA (cytosine-5)-methyltransferase 1
VRRFLSVDLFAGCGGLSLGLKDAGFTTVLFSELNSHAAATFKENLGSADQAVAGDVDELTEHRLRELREEWSTRADGIDLVAGGPPCQGYSGIGHRRSHVIERTEVPSNHLYHRMIEVIRTVRPKIFLFENVRGLLTGRWRASGDKGEIWRDVRTHFRAIRGYEVGWKLVHASDYGVPQNRPRIILVGVRRDLGIELEKDRPEDATNNPRGLIPSGNMKAPHLSEVLEDLLDPDFAKVRETTRYLNPAVSEFQKQMRVDKDGHRLRVGMELREMEYSRHSTEVRAKFAYMIKHHGEIPRGAETKKFAQRVLPAQWDSRGPTITATSLPDDFVHYSQARILTVREWARLQMFPDWYVFKGPRTTGGHRRAGSPSEGIWDREVPKYTQIGNAVPVGLARALGEHFVGLLSARR